MTRESEEPWRNELRLVPLVVLDFWWSVIAIWQWKGSKGRRMKFAAALVITSATASLIVSVAGWGAFLRSLANSIFPELAKFPSWKMQISWLKSFSGWLNQQGAGGVEVRRRRRGGVGRRVLGGARAVAGRPRRGQVWRRRRRARLCQLRVAGWFSTSLLRC